MILGTAATQEQNVFICSWQHWRFVCSRLDNIDLFVAGVSETPIADGQMGPTFTCILASQFREIRRGDRFYYGFPDAGFNSRK